MTMRATRSKRSSGRRSERALLSTYRAKRRFDATPEPTGSKRIRPRGAHRFVVQKHEASHLHYDFRLEADGVLKSWAIPKGPSLDPKERRLAMQVEDHPLDYFDFEGIIPAGNYGAGEVIVWDWGTYEIVGGKDEGHEGGSASAAIAAGRLKIRMQGEKLKGTFTLVKIKGRGGSKDNAWLLFKDKDEDADPKWKVEAHGESVKTGETIDDLKADVDAPRWKGKAERAVSKGVKKRAPAKKAAGRTSAGKDPIPRVTTPELATLIDAPFDDDDWLFEVKWDGFRAIATIDADRRVHLASRNGNDLLARFPKLESIGAAFGGLPVVVDGEIVAFDAEGRSSFQRLQNGAGAKISYAVFDVLYAEGRDLRGEPLDARKEVLERIVEGAAKDVVVSKHVVGKGKELFAAASGQGLEGIVAKRRASPYLEKRTRDWLKIKALLEQECVIVGYTEPGGGRTGFGSLLLGLYERGKLVFCGSVGTGFDAKMLASLSKKMKQLETKSAPFAKPPKTKTPAHWVAPKLVAQVRFTEWTRDGSMRHPAFLGLRDDKRPQDVHRERARPAAEVT